MVKGKLNKTSKIIIVIMTMVLGIYPFGLLLFKQKSFKSLDHIYFLVRFCHYSLKE